MPWSDYEMPEDPLAQDGFESIGRLVLQRRIEAGWTQRQLQELSGVHQSMISRIENGKQPGIRWSRFGRLIGALGGVDPPPEPPRRPWPGPAGHGSPERDGP